MRIATLSQTRYGEKRVALTPEAAKKLVGDGHTVTIETGAGIAIGAASGVALARKFERLPDAPREAARIAGWGNLHAGLGLARATSRVWWPIAVPLAALSRRLRRALAVALVAPAAYEWWRGRRPADLPRSVALRLADDMAYGVGVWAAVLRARDARALRPELVEWPGRRPAVQDDTVPAS